MKQISILILCIYSMFAQAQAYQPFPVTRAIWTMQHVNYWLNDADDYKYVLWGDTSIAGQAYKKIYQTTDSIVTPTSILSASFAVALRESGQQVFIIPKDSTSEFMLYDFTGNVGDTVHIYNYLYGNMQANQKPILGIDSVLISGVQHRRFRFQGWTNPDEYWIEGIGSDIGLLEPFMSLSDNSIDLACFQLDTNSSALAYDHRSSLFEPSSVYCIDSFAQILGVQRITDSKNCALYPNPSSESIQLELKNGTDAIEFISIYNTLGQLQTQYPSNFTQQQKLYIGDLAKGIYFIQVQTQERKQYVLQFQKL